MEAFVYILQDENGKYYVGSTVDLGRRLKQHERKHTQTTARMKNPKLVFSQKCENILTARITEKKIKNLKRKDYIAQIVSDGYIKKANLPSSFNG